jgi:hypothetical protein
VKNSVYRSPRLEGDSTRIVVKVDCFGKNRLAMTSNG